KLELLEKHSATQGKINSEKSAINQKKAVNNTINSPIPKKSAIEEERMVLLCKVATENKMLKNTVYQETCPTLFNALAHYGKGFTEKGDQLLQQAMKEQPNHPYGLMWYAQRHLTQGLTTKDYAPTKKILIRALSNGLVTKTTRDKTKQFHDSNFLSALLWYIEA